MAEKVFRDPVHDFITVEDDLLLALIDTPEFQRLRRIRQLGASYGTYHGAEHSRFSHAIGVLHVMQRVLKRFRDLGLTPEPVDRLAALAAALLHDLGHGPFSHLWEHTCCAHLSHEAWTRRIILDGTGVNRVLRRHDPALPERVLAVLDGTHPVRYLSSLVSGQLDVDRMDYLLRDALYTGATYGRFDLERLIYTMAVAGEQVVVSRKGLANVEEYLLARYFMYWQVYFHKTTRAQEVLFRRLLERVRDLTLDRGPEAAPVPPALRPFLAGAPGLGDLLAVDDVDVLHAVKIWTAAADQVLRDLAGRFLNRRLLKPVFADPVDDAPPDAVEAVRELVGRRGWDARYYFAIDRASDVAYDYYVRHPDGAAGGAVKGAGRKAPVPILIVEKDGLMREVSEVSPLIRALAAGPRTGLNLFVPEDCRDEARSLLVSGGAATC